MIDKRSIEDMNDDELLALTEEQIERLVKLEMAKEGIPIYPIPDAPEYLDVEDPDGEFFSFRLFDGVVFPTAEGIRDVVNLMKALGCERLVREYGEPGAQHLPNILKSRYSDDDDFEIKSEKLFSADGYLRNKGILKENEKRRKAYENELSTISKSKKDAQKIRDSIWGPIREAKTRKIDCERADIQFAEYLDLAENDAEQAWKFFDKANGPEEHVEKFLRAKYSIPLGYEKVGE